MRSYAPYKQTPFKSLNTYGKSVQQLGTGSYGEVELYVDDNGTKYAVKNMKNDGQGIRVHTLREISILNKLSHPNIINIFDVNIDPDKTMMIMEAAASDLNKYMKINVLTSEEIMVFMYQLAKGLEYMHSQMVWHRDIKPANLLVFNDGTIKYTDFGLARFGALPNTRYTDMIFTLYWRPPEILLGTRTYGPEVDIWALGIVFGEMVRNTFVIRAKDAAETLKRIVKKIGRMTAKDWPGISGMKNFKEISNINEQHPNGSIWSEQIIKDKLNDVGIDLLFKMLTPNPSHRISIQEIIRHPYFNPVSQVLNEKYKYEIIPEMICHSSRIAQDMSVPNAVYGGEITNNMVEIIFEWLNEVVTEYNLTAQTLLYARNLFDKYFSITKSSISKKDLQLLGITVLLISGKIFEIYPPVIEDYVYISDNAFAKKQIIEMEREVIMKLQFQLMFPNIHEYISYYNEGTSHSVISDSEIIAKIIMIDAEIPNHYFNHVIAATIVYIVAKGNGEYPKCLTLGSSPNSDPNMENEYNTLAKKFITAIKRIKEKYKESWTSTLKPGERRALYAVLERWENPLTGKEHKTDSPLMHKLSDLSLSKNEKETGKEKETKLQAIFIAVKDEDVTRENLFNYVNDYIMSRALNFANYHDFTNGEREKFADYFGFVLAPNKKYLMKTDKSEKISYDLGKFTVESVSKVNFRHIPSELEYNFTEFISYLKVPTKFSTMELFGTIQAI